MGRLSHSIANLLLVYFYWNIGTVNYDVQCFGDVEGSGIRSVSPVQIGSRTRNKWCSVPQEPVVLGTPGTRN